MNARSVAKPALTKRAGSEPGYGQPVAAGAGDEADRARVALASLRPDDLAVARLLAEAPPPGWVAPAALAEALGLGSRQVGVRLRRLHQHQMVRRRHPEGRGFGHPRVRYALRPPFAAVLNGPLPPAG